MPAMRFKRQALSAVVFQEQIWAIGGSTKFRQSVAIVEVFDLSKKRYFLVIKNAYNLSILFSWNTLTSMPHKTSNHATVTTEGAGGLIFTLGGEHDGTSLDTVATYPLTPSLSFLRIVFDCKRCNTEGTWIEIASMSTIRSGLAAVPIGKFVYL
jgi:hypothetical protein